MCSEIKISLFKFCGRITAKLTKIKDKINNNHTSFDKAYLIGLLSYFLHLKELQWLAMCSNCKFYIEKLLQSLRHNINFYSIYKNFITLSCLVCYDLHIKVPWMTMKRNSFINLFIEYVILNIHAYQLKYVNHP